MHLLNRNFTVGVYSLKLVTSAEDYDVYCHMTDIETCGGGGNLGLEGLKKIWSTVNAFASLSHKLTLQRVIR